MNLSKIKTYIPPALRPAAEKTYRFFKYDIYYYLKNKKFYQSRKNLPDIYLIGTPEHYNLGDHAIALAALQVFRRCLPSDSICEITQEKYLQQLRCIQKYAGPNAVILINGGGNMGVEWFFYEDMIRTVIRKLRHNRIIVLPQTIDYGKSEYAKREFENSKRIYAKHSDLHLIAREKYSYEIMKKAYPQNDVLLMPDIVLSLNFSLPHLHRDGILLCFRRDVEKSLPTTAEKEIRDFCGRYSESVRFTDTVLEHPVEPAAREQEVTRKLEEFKRARLVITDRLHGMIFCAITGTPCIALSNYNHKVKGVYEWIRNLEYIKYLEEYRDIPKYAGKLLNLKTCDYDSGFCIPYLRALEKIILQGKEI